MYPRDCGCQCLIRLVLLSHSVLEGIQYQITHLKVIGVGGRGAGGSCPVPRFPADGALLPLEFRDEHHPKRPVGSFEFQMHGPYCRWVGFRCCRLPFVLGDPARRSASPPASRTQRAVQPSAAAGPLKGGGPENNFFEQPFLLARTSRKQPSELFGARPEILCALAAADRILTCCLTICRTSAD